MSIINLTESDKNQKNLYYLQSSLSELFINTRCSLNNNDGENRAILSVNCPDEYEDIVRAEIIDKVAEVIVIKYKYDFFKKNLSIGGLSSLEKEILLASLISADLMDDKRYTIDRLKNQCEIAVDGIFNFRLKPLKHKWEDVSSYMPSCFTSNQLKDFITYLLEGKKKRVYIDQGKVYDGHFRRLKRSTLLDGEDGKIVREILLSNCGEVEIAGQISSVDEKYIKEFYKDKIFFSTGYYS